MGISNFAFAFVERVPGFRKCLCDCVISSVVCDALKGEIVIFSKLVSSRSLFCSCLVASARNTTACYRRKIARPLMRLILAMLFREEAVGTGCEGLTEVTSHHRHHRPY